MSVAERRSTFPKSVQPGIPRVSETPEGWKRYKLGELFDVVPRKVNLENDKSYDLVTVKRARGGLAFRASLIGSKIAVKTQFELAENDFLISKRQIVHGACGVVTKEFSGSIVSNEYSVLRCKAELDLGYLNYLSHSIYFQQTCFHSSIGVHIEKMIFKLDEWFKWPVNLPPLPEQKKIAAFLGVVDAKIAGLKARQEGLERYKRGLMQALFSQRLRFTRSDGTAFPDWEEKRLGEAIVVRAGDFKSASEISEQQETGFYPCYGGNGTRGYVSSFNRDGRFSLVGRQGALCGNVHFVEGKFHATEHALVVEAPKHMAPEWLFFQLVHMKLNRYATGLAQPGISAETMKGLRVPFPHPDEQQKIADALQAMDAKIAAVAGQVAKMEDFKKGLLQQMFV